DCALVLSATTVASLGAGAFCSWESPSALVVTLGNNAPILPGDSVEVKDGAAIYTWVSWALLPLAGGGVANQRVASEAGAAITLRSPRLSTPACAPVVLPERVTLQTAVPVEADVSVSDAVPFWIGAERFMAVARSCRGRNCEWDGSAQGKRSIASQVWRWLPDGTMTLHQTIPTHGARQVVHFTQRDARFTGG
ncbi:hypothetical protein T484DRAFT_1800782, partial [Baffinella frigidus]